MRQLLAEPSVPNPPRRVWHDWVLICLLVPTAVVEAVLRNDLGWPVLAVLIGVPPIFTLLWRRSHPLAVVAIVFAAHGASEAVTHVGSEHSAMLYTTAWLLILPYSLFRWGSGRQCGIGLMVMLFVHVPNGSGAGRSPAAIFGATAFLLFPAAVGAAMRYRSTSRVREVDQAKSLEREQLARELHDSVAHHVSAIIIQAQAGRTLADDNPGAATAALEVIEAEASRTLGEMRTMVAALRRGENPDLAPQRGVADIGLLAHETTDGPRIDVAIESGLTELRPVIGAAVYRLAQEAITNALRHARHATRIEVRVVVDDVYVRLTVHDDGDHNAFGTGAIAGFGLIGMSERARLLGGTLEAGPSAGRGWDVTAVLPLGAVPA